MKRVTASGLVLACLLLAGTATGAEKKNMTTIDLKKLKQDNVVPNQKHTTMGALGERVYGGAFGPWRCQVKILDRRNVNEKMKGENKDRSVSTHFLTLSILDPAAGRGVPAGNGTVTFTGPDKVKAKANLQPMGGLFSADIDLPKAGEYAIQIDFISGKQKGAAKFSYSVK